VWKDIITLRTETIEQDADGYPTTTCDLAGVDEELFDIYLCDDVEVYANKKSVARAEFYHAYAVGIEAKIVFEVRSEDYDGQKVILHEGKAYEVIRSFQKGEGTVELICSDKAV